MEERRGSWGGSAECSCPHPAETARPVFLRRGNDHPPVARAEVDHVIRSEERRGGEEGRSRGGPARLKKKNGREERELGWECGVFLSPPRRTRAPRISSPR